MRKLCSRENTGVWLSFIWRYLLGYVSLDFLSNMFLHANPPLWLSVTLIIVKLVFAILLSRLVLGWALNKRLPTFSD